MLVTETYTGENWNENKNTKWINLWDESKDRNENYGQNILVLIRLLYQSQFYINFMI